MARGNEVNVNDSKRVVPLSTWVLISSFKLTYNLLLCPDVTFDCHLAEFLDRKVPANAIPVDGVYSFDVIIDQEIGLLSRVYRPVEEGQDLPSVADLEKPVPSDIVPVIVFFHGGSFAHSSINSAIYDTLCRRLIGVCRAVVVSVNYRLAPENCYPCAYDDCWAAVKWANSRKWLQSKMTLKFIYFCAVIVLGVILLSL